MYSQSSYSIYMDNWLVIYQCAIKILLTHISLSLGAGCTHLTKWLTKWLTIWLAGDALLATIILG